MYNKTHTVNTLTKLNNYFLPLISWNFFTKEGKNETKQIIKDKTLYVQNNNLRQAQKLYTTTGGDGADILEVCIYDF